MNDITQEIARLTSMQKCKSDLKTKAELFDQVFSSPAGQKVLNELKAELVPRVVKGPDTHSTYFNLGLREAYMYIENMISYAREREDV